MCFTRQFTTINLQWAISCNEFKSRCLGWSGIHFIFTVTTVTVLIRIAYVEFIFFVVYKAIIIRFYTILQRVFCNKCSESLKAPCLLWWWWCLVTSRQVKKHDYTLETTIRKCHWRRLQRFFKEQFK